MDDELATGFQQFMGPDLAHLQAPPPADDPLGAGFQQFMGDDVKRLERVGKPFPTDEDGFVKVEPNDPTDQAMGLSAALKKYRTEYKEKGTGVGEFIGQNVLPFASSIVRQKQEKDYGDTLGKIQAGTATADDIENAAKYQAYQEHKSRSTTGEAVGTGLGQAAAFVGEFASGGKLLKPLGALVKGAPVLGALAREGAIAPTAVGAIGKAGAMSAITPETLESAQSRATETGGSKFDIKNLAPAAAISTLQNLVLGSLGETAKGVPTVGGRLAARTAIGMGEQQLVDTIAGATGLQTSYGAIPDLIAGKEGATKHAATQFATFALFAAKHGLHEQAAKMEDTFHEAWKEAKANGDSPEVAGQKAAAAIQPIAQEMQKAVESAPVKQPVESPAFDKPINDSFNTHFKDVEARADGTLYGKQGQTEFYAKPNPENKSIVLTFTDVKGREGGLSGEGLAAANKERVAKGMKPIEAGVGKQARVDSIAAMRALKAFVGDIAQTGINIEYDAKGEQRQTAYDKALRAIGYEPIKTPEPDAALQTYVWGPKKAAEAPAATPPAGITDEMKAESMWSGQTDNGRVRLAGEDARSKRDWNDLTPEQKTAAMQEMGFGRQPATAEPAATTPVSGPSESPEAKIVGPGASGEPANLAITPEMAVSLRRLGFPDPAKAPPAVLEAMRGEGKPVVTPQKAATFEAPVESAPEPKPTPPVGMPKGKELFPIHLTTKGELLDKIEASKLTPEEKQVLNERIMWGTPMGELARDLGYKGQGSIENIEKRALAKLGFKGSVDQFHQSELGSQGRDTVETANAHVDELHLVDGMGYQHNRILNEIADAQDQLNELDRKFAKAKKKGEMTDEERQQFSAEYKRLGSLIAASQGQSEPAIPRGQEQPAADAGVPEVERVAGGQDQGAGAAGENARPGPAAGESAQPAERQTANQGAESGVRAGDRIQVPGLRAVHPPYEATVKEVKPNGEWVIDTPNQTLYNFKPERYDEVGGVKVVTGMGAATPTPPSPPPPPGTPGAAGATTPPPQPPKPSGSWFRSARDWLNSFAQKSFPALTRLSRESGEKLAEASNAPAAAKSSWDYFSRILKLNNTPIGDLPPEVGRELMATWYERRFRHYREYLTDAAAKTADPLKKAELLAQAAEVRTFVGQPGSPLVDEQRYQENLDGMWSFFEGIKQHWTPEVEANYRGLKGLDPNDAIDAPSQIPGLPLNAIAVTPDTPGAVRPGAKQSMANLRLRKPGFTRQAELNAEAYDLDMKTVMGRTLELGIPAARRAEFARQAIADGVMAKVEGGEAPPEGFKYLGLDPSGGLKGLDPNARYYVHPEAYRDVVQGLGIGERPGQAIAGGIRPAMDVLYNVSLMSPVELATHMGNHVTALFRPGMGVPILNLKKTFTNAWDIYRKDPVILEKIMDLAKMSASFEHEAKGGIAKSLVELGRFIPGANPERVQRIGEAVGKYDPTTYVNKFTSGLIGVMQKAVRVQLGDAFDNVARSGKFENTETAKRDFINQALGNYNSQASNRLAQFVKDSGLQSFATAAHTFTTQGIKSVYGGAINAPTTGVRARAQLSGVAMLKMLPMLTMGPVINAIAWNGDAFPDGIPPFAIKTREDEDGKLHYFDPLAFTGVRRGARATGLHAVVEGAIRGKTPGQIADQALLRDIPRAIEHLGAGPPVQTLHTLLTGEDAMGHRVAPTVSTAQTAPGRAAAMRKGLPPQGSSQALENAKAAGIGLNPLVKSFTEEPKRPRTWIENIMQSFGPFGEKTRDVPKRRPVGMPR